MMFGRFSLLPIQTRSSARWEFSVQGSLRELSADCVELGGTRE